MGARINNDKINKHILTYLLSNENRSIHKLIYFFKLGGHLNKQQLNEAIHQCLHHTDECRYQKVKLLHEKGAIVSKSEAKEALVRALILPIGCRGDEVRLARALGGELTSQELHDFILTPTNDQYEYYNTLFFLEWGGQLTDEETSNLIRRVFNNPKPFAERVLKNYLRKITL